MYSCGTPERVEHYLLHCNNYMTVCREIIHEINVAYNEEILLKGCPLYSEGVNGDMFSIVHKFIIENKRF